jgi:hypothetical protein
MLPSARGDFPSEQRWADFSRFGDSIRYDMPQPKTREALLPSVDEQRNAVTDAYGSIFKIQFDGLNLPFIFLEDSIFAPPLSATRVAA